MRTFYLLAVFCTFCLIFCENIFYKKLDKLLSFCLANRGSLDYGTFFGISIAKQELLNEKSNKHVEKILKKCDFLEKRFDAENREYFSQEKLPNVGSLLEKVIKIKPFTNLFPTQFDKFHTKSSSFFDSVEIYLKLVNDKNNMPNGMQSDYCLFEVLDCRFSKRCAKVENISTPSFGYPQTHK